MRSGKTFRDDEAKERFLKDFIHRSYTTTRTVDHEFFAKANIDCFQRLEQIGWGAFFATNENIYPVLIKEFYSNLVFDSSELRATSLMKGRKIELSQEFLADVIACPNEGIEHYFSHKEIPYEGYSREKAIRELMNGKSDVLDVARLDVSNRLLIHAISQTIVPRVVKSNNPTFLEIFYAWCALQGLPLNLLYTILNHMRYVVSSKKAELPYGTILTLIAKRRGVNLSVYDSEEPSS